ncbi:MAG: PAS domain S-box protein [Actinobacteria bacterium]|nr:PAS domain S-box protein [Actinomycetota bacterium]
MAKSAAWIYWLGIVVVLLGVMLPMQPEIERTPVLLLTLGGFLSTVALIVIPWGKFSYKLFYAMSALACSHIATLIYFSGGVGSPFSELYFLIAIWAAYFFSFRGYLLVTLFVIASYLTPYFYDAAYDSGDVTAAFLHILFMLIAGGLVNLLVRQVRERNEELNRTTNSLALKMREVLHEKEKTTAVLASVADGVYVVDIGGQIILWNRAAEAITGYTAEEMIGTDCYGSGDEGVSSPFCATAASVSEGFSSTGYEVLISGKSGDRMWLSVSAAPIRDTDGAVSGIVHVFRDISEYKEIDRMKSDFVATVSHELRTPLTSILGFSKTLLRTDASFSDASRQSFLLEIVREGERLARLIEDVLSVSRIEAGNLRLDLKPVVAAPTVNQVVKSVSRLTSIHEFVTDVPEDLPRVNADPDKLYQVLLNLVVNAIKYSPDGGPITVIANASGASVLFEVRDEGVGISPEHLPHVFERFYRAALGKGAAAGTGLGLYVSKSLLEQMGGRIWVESEFEKGSRFFFELPVAAAEEASDEKIAS